MPLQPTGEEGGSFCIFPKASSQTVPVKAIVLGRATAPESLWTPNHGQTHLPCTPQPVIEAKGHQGLTWVVTLHTRSCERMEPHHINCSVHSSTAQNQ